MKITKEKIVENFKKLSEYLFSNEIEALYLSGSDYYLSEYSAKEDSLRNYLTPFTGSTAEVLIIPFKTVYLFVDGRYHLQAELECKEFNTIEVVKVNSATSNFQALLNTIIDLEVKVLGVVAERTQFTKAEKFISKNTEIKLLSSIEIEKIIELDFKISDSEVYVISETILPSNYEEKFKALNLPIKQAIYLSSCDDIAWLSHCRSYQIMGNSYFLSKAIVTSDHLYIFVPEGTNISAKAKALNDVTFYTIVMNELEHYVHKVLHDNGITQVAFDPHTITLKDYEMLKGKFEGNDLLRRLMPVTQLRIHKSHDEIKEFEKIFLKSSQAIAETIRYSKQKIKDNVAFSEKDLANKIWEEYKVHGAKALSFKTIAGTAETSAIIHYSACSPDRLITNGSMTLLDSGAYYESGMATDCTRCFIPGFKNLNLEKQNYYKKIYTIVLKAQLQAEMSVFKPGTLGNTIDQVSRGVMLRQGMDFGHGLGHGVGILVHDPGAGRLSPLSREELHPGVVCSIEPGYYLEGQFGLRLENVVYVDHHPQYLGLLKFKPLIYVAWEEELIDQTLLAPEEVMYLNWYQTECRKYQTTT